MEKRESFAHALCSIFERKQLVSHAESQAMQKEFKASSKETFVDFLLEEGLVAEEDVLSALADHYQVPAVDVTGYFFEPFLLRKFPKDVLHRHAFIPQQVEENIMSVVTSEPDDPQLLPLIGQYVSYDIQFYVGIRRDITDAITEFYDKSVTQVQEDVDLRTEDLEERGFREQSLEDQEQESVSDEDVLD